MTKKDLVASTIAFLEFIARNLILGNFYCTVHTISYPETFSKALILECS